MNQSCMPPCRDVLLNKVKQTNLVTAMWKLALLGEACPLDLSLHRWSIVDGHYAIQLFDGYQLPQAVWSLLEIQVVKKLMMIQSIEIYIFGSDKSDGSEESYNE